MEKKRGRYAEAAEWTAKALAIKPEGHLGLGDWYLKNLQFRVATAAAPGKPPAKNFLGLDYAATFRPAFGEAGPSAAPDPSRGDLRVRMQRMLENDQTFADGFLVTGDSLAGTGDLNLAFLCFRRAQELKHPHPAQVTRRLQALYDHFNQLTYDGSSSREYRESMARVKKQYDAMAAKAFAAAAEWLRVFQKTEAELVALYGDGKTTVDLVEQSMQARGVKRPLP